MKLPDELAMIDATTMAYKLYTAYQEAGFTPGQAWELLLRAMP